MCGKVSNIPEVYDTPLFELLLLEVDGAAGKFIDTDAGFVSKVTDSNKKKFKGSGNLDKKELD